MTDFNIQFEMPVLEWLVWNAQMKMPNMIGNFQSVYLKCQIEIPAFIVIWSDHIRNAQSEMPD